MARLYLGNITYGATPDELKDWFKEKGVEVVKLIWPRDGNNLRPFAFIDVADEDDERIISELCGQVFKGRSIQVSTARPKRVV